MTDKRPSMHDVHAAMVRAEQVWALTNSHTQNEGAYLDRAVLARYVKWLQEELQSTQDALDEADREIESITQRTP